MKRALLVACAAVVLMSGRPGDTAEAGVVQRLQATGTPVVGEENPFHVRSLDLRLGPRLGRSPAEASGRALVSLGVGVSERGVVQLKNSRTGVTCTMLIVPMGPNPDAGILGGHRGLVVDDMVRNSMSPCVE
jgi:hypothetical protein